VRIALVVALAGCPAPYRSGDLAHAVALDCVDVDLQTERVAPAAGIVVDWRLGNHCERAVRIDVSRARLFAVTDEAPRVELHAYDPRHEIIGKWLAAGAIVSEAIEYLPPAAPTWLVVELAGLDGSAPRASARLTIRMAPERLP
jgi:hypothetical protein